MTTFAQFLRDTRKKKKLTQPEAAEQLDIHANTLSNWERGLKPTNYQQINKVAKWAGCSVHHLHRLLSAQK